MANTAKALFRGAATTNTATVLYTVPTTSTTTVVTNIAVTNTDTASGTFTLAIDGIALHSATTISASTTVYIDCKQVIPANATPKTITGGASATTVKFHISGMEIV